MPVPGAGPAQPAGSIQSPPQGMLGEASRIRASGCTLPSPSNRGLKWVKEEGGGPGGLGEGPEELGRHPEGGDQGRMPAKAKPCVRWALGGQGRAAKDLGALKITSKLTPRGLSPGSCPQRSLPLCYPLTSRALFSPNPSASSRAPPPHQPAAKGSVRRPLSQLRPPPWLRAEGGPSLAQRSSQEVQPGEKQSS